MAINPLKLMQMKQKLNGFRERHPKFYAFIKQMNKDALVPGTVMEIKVTSPDGKEISTSLRLSPEDVEAIQMAAAMRG